MKGWEIEQQLQQVSDFEAPKAQYEQYVTPAHLASQLTQLLATEKCIENGSVCDLGCGTGVLTMSAVLAGANHVVGVDVDIEALSLARTNLENDDECVDLIHADVLEYGVVKQKCYDIVVTNPPFGTKRRGVDIAFLQIACNLATVAVYSMHKTSTRDYIHRRFQSFGVSAEPLARMRFALGKNFKFHREEVKDIDVDLWRLDVTNANIIDELIHVERPIEVVGNYDVEGRRVKRGRGRGRGRRR